MSLVADSVSGWASTLTFVAAQVNDFAVEVPSMHRRGCLAREGLRGASVTKPVMAMKPASATAPVIGLRIFFIVRSLGCRVRTEGRNHVGCALSVSPRTFRG